MDTVRKVTDVLTWLRERLFLFADYSVDICELCAEYFLPLLLSEKLKV